MRVQVLQMLLAANPVLVQCLEAHGKGADAGRRRHQLLSMTLSTLLTLPTLLERVPAVYHWHPGKIATILPECSMLARPLE